MLCWYVRFGDEWHTPDEFIRQDNMVRQAAHDIAGHADNEDQAALLLWDYVCREIRYPMTLKGESTDYHLLKAFPVSEGLFGPRFLITLASDEFFQFPSETLGWGKVADCDGSAILLGTLLRNFLPAERVNVVVGSSHGGEEEADHAWVETMVGGEWIIMETTLSSLPGDVIPRAVGVSARVAANGDYLPFVNFNDTGYDEIIPCVISHANEPAKLARISKLWGWPTKSIC
jgi:hypothetical protein